MSLQDKHNPADILIFSLVKPMSHIWLLELQEYKSVLF